MLVRMIYMSDFAILDFECLFILFHNNFEILSFVNDFHVARKKAAQAQFKILFDSKLLQKAFTSVIFLRVLTFPSQKNMTVTLTAVST